MVLMASPNGSSFSGEVMEDQPTDVAVLRLRAAGPREDVITEPTQS